MPYYGDYAEDSTNFSFKFTTRTVAGVPSALTWTTGMDVYKDEEVAQSTAGITFTTTFDSVVGLNLLEIDLSADAFYAVGSNYTVVITSGTVNSVSVAGEVVGEFSIENRFSTNAVTDALNNYGVSTVSSASMLDIATTALETHGASTITTGDVDTSLATYGVSTVTTGNIETGHTNYGASTLGTTEHKDITTTALEDYGASTLGTTEFVDAATTALETYGPSTHTTTDITDEFNTYGGSTHTTTDVFDQSKNAISSLGVATTADVITSTDVDDSLANYGASTHTTTDVFDQAKNAISSLGVSTMTSTDVDDSLTSYGPSTHTTTDVKDQVVAGLSSDTYAEPGQGTPGATISLADKIGYQYKGWRNQSDQSTDTYQLYNDDAVTVDQKATVSATTSLATKGELVTGP